MTRIAAYCRVSTDKDEQLSSLENQRSFFEEYARKNGMHLTAIYADEGISGKQMNNRCEFMRLLADAQRNCFDVVVTKDISRFARNTADFLYGIRRLKSLNIDVIFLSNNQKVLGESEFVLTMFAALAQQESEFLSKRVIFGKKESAKKGRTPNVIYGYDKTGTFDLSPNLKEAKVVKMIFNWYTESEIGLRKIAQNLNQQGIVTKKNSLWTAKTVKRIIENPIYCGILINNKSETENFLEGTRKQIPKREWLTHHRPQFKIISKSQFLKAQEILSQRREKYNSKGEIASNRHVFSSLIRCLECGSLFTRKKYVYKNTYIRWRCQKYNSMGKKGCCNSFAVDENELILSIKNYLSLWLKDIPESRCLKILSDFNPKKQKENSLPEISNAIDRLKKKKERFIIMYANAIIDMDTLKKECNLLDNSIFMLQEKISKASEYNFIENSRQNPKKFLNEIIFKTDFDNKDIKKIINTIEVSKEGKIKVFLN